MIYVQHLLGVGHLQRMRFLAGALACHGFRVELISGGMPQAGPCADGYRLHQLAPVRCADARFDRLLDSDGNEIDDAFRDSRRRQLLALFERLSPQVLITETFPFGRRMMSFELLPLLQRARAARENRLVISSIRDILQPKSKPERNREICDLVEQYYDYVLIHGDPGIARLADSFADAERIEKRLFYSGYIRNPGSDAAADNIPGEVLVSAGGSGTGLDILESAIAARPLCSLKNRHWRILVSPAIDDADFASLQRLAGDGFTVERNRPDFAALIQNAGLSISQAGYNTITDLLQSRAAAVLIPFDEAGEVEQKLRAGGLQRRGRAAMLEAKNLAPAKLADTIEKALELDRSISVDLDGAAKSAALIETWLRSGAA